MARERTTELKAGGKREAERDAQTLLGAKKAWKMGGAGDWIALTRAEHAAIVAIAVVASEFVTLKRFSPELFYPALGPALITLGAFAWNDYFGIKTDRIMKRLDRPLVSGRIGAKAAFYGALAFFALGLLSAAAVNANEFAVAALFTALAMLYDPVLKKIPLAGNAFIASSMSISFIYGNLAAAPGGLSQYVILYAVIAFTMGLGRELALTLRDVEGDRRIGARTLPMLLGARKTAIASSALFHAAVALSLIPLVLAPGNYAYLALAGATCVLLLYSAWMLVLDQGSRSLGHIRNHTLFALATGVLAFAALGL